MAPSKILFKADEETSTHEIEVFASEIEPQFKKKNRRTHFRKSIASKSSLLFPDHTLFLIYEYLFFI